MSYCHRYQPQATVAYSLASHWRTGLGPDRLIHRVLLRGGWFGRRERCPVRPFALAMPWPKSRVYLWGLDKHTCNIRKRNKKHFKQRFKHLHTIQHQKSLISYVHYVILSPFHLSTHDQFSKYIYPLIHKEQGSICETRTGPNRPLTRKGMGFCILKIYFLWKSLFMASLTTSGRVFFDRNGQKAHLRTKIFDLSL